MQLRIMTLAIVSLIATNHQSVGAEPSTRPNFVVILMDNLGKDWLTCYGNDENRTPSIDQLAAGGIRFDNFYVTSMRSTTRVALLTGRYGFRTGWHTHHDAAIYGGGNLDWNREKTFAKALQTAGDATAITGKWQLNDLYEHYTSKPTPCAGTALMSINSSLRWINLACVMKRS